MSIPADSIGLLTVVQAAAAMGVREATIRTWIRRYPKDVVSARVGGRVMVAERSLMKHELRMREDPFVPARGPDGKFVRTT